MNIIVQRILSLLKNYSMRLHFLLTRQKVIIIDEKHIVDFIRSNGIDTNSITCYSCGSNLSVKQIQGWFLGKEGKVLFFCNDPTCSPLNKDRG